MSDNVYEKMWKELKETVENLEPEHFLLDVESILLTMRNMESENGQ